MNDNGYPVRGIIQGFIEKSFTFDEIVEMINGYIEASAKKGYSHGVIDGLRRNGEKCHQTSYKGSVSLVNGNGVEIPIGEQEGGL